MSSGEMLDKKPEGEEGGKKGSAGNPVTLEKVQKSFADLIDSIKGEIETISKAKSTQGKGRVRGTGVKFLQSVTKRLRTLQTDVNRIAKPKRQRKVSSNVVSNNSGIMREVLWSPTLCEFMGKEPGTRMSRVAATKIICDYIAGVRYDKNGNRIQGYAYKRDQKGGVILDKNGKPLEDKNIPLLGKKGVVLACEPLQDPKDRKVVLADDALRKLFGEERFSYTKLQKLLSTHIMSEPQT